MRKYIVAIMLAFAMLTSCVIDEGDNRKPIDIGEYVASMVLSSYKYDVVENVALALVTDWYLSTGDEAIRHNYLDGYQVENSEGVVTVIRTFNHSTPRTIASFSTNGILLSDGGLWVMNGYVGIVITIASKGDGRYLYTITSDDGVLEYNIDVELLSRDVKDGLRFNMDGDIYFEASRGNPSDQRAIVSSEIKTPIEIYITGSQDCRFLSGSASVVCENPAYGTVDRVEMSFSRPGVCEVTYLDYFGEVRVGSDWLSR